MLLFATAARTARACGVTWVEAGLLLGGAALVTAMHTLVMALFGWPAAPNGIAPGISVAHGFQWGISGMALLLVGSLLVAPYNGRSMSAIMATGAYFLYGVFIAHALFDARFGGDWVDPLLYSGSAALVVLFVVIVFRLVLPD